MPVRITICSSLPEVLVAEKLEGLENGGRESLHLHCRAGDSGRRTAGHQFRVLPPPCPSASDAHKRSQTRPGQSG